MQVAAGAPTPAASGVERAATAAGMGAKGFADSALEAIGLVPDFVASGFKAVGLPAPEDPHFYTKGLKKAYQTAGETLAAPLKALGVPDVTLPDKPQNTEQRLAYGAGRGAADALSFMVPAAAVAKTAKAGSTAEHVANALMAAPAAQIGAGSVGGAVGQETDSPALGILAALGTAGSAEGLRNLSTRAFRPDLSALTSAEPGAARAAAQYVSKIADTAGKGTNAISRAAADFEGKPVTAAEAIGRPGVGALAALGRRAGTTPDALEGVLGARAAAAPDRMLADFADTLGVSPQAAEGNFEALIQAGREKAKPLYAEAYKANPNIASKEIDRILETPAGKRALTDARKMMQNDMTLMGVTDPELLAQAKEAGQKLPFKGGVASGLKMETLDYVKRALDDQINAAFRAGNRQEGGVIVGLKNRMVKELENADITAQAGPNSLKPEGGKYAQARKAAGEYLGAQNQYAVGQKVLFDPNTSVRKMTAMLADMDGPSLEAFKGGVAQRIFTMQQNGRLRPAVLDVPAVRGKLAALFGPENADAFIGRVKAEAKLAVTGNRMMPGKGSATQELNDAMADQDNGKRLRQAADIASIGVHLGKGNVLPALMRMGQVAFDTAAHPRRAVMPVATRDEAGRLLMLSPDDLANYLTQVDATKTAAVPQILRDPALSRDVVAALLMGRNKDIALNPR